MKFPKKKTIKKKYKQKDADRLFSLLIRHRGVCQAKGKDSVSCGGNLQCAHIVGRANGVLRYDENNALCLCAGHHNWYTYHPFEWFTVFIPQNFPAQFAYVQRRRGEMVKKTANRFKMIIGLLDAQLTELGVVH